MKAEGMEPLMSRWLNYLANERAEKLHQIDALGSGLVQLHMTTEGVRRDITAERLERLKADVAEIEQILREAGCTWPDMDGD
jgi:hypothetical protein